MTTSKLSKCRTLIIIIFLIAAITIGGTVAWSRYRASQPIEISIPPNQELQQAEIYISGAVINPGFLPYSPVCTHQWFEVPSWPAYSSLPSSWEGSAMPSLPLHSPQLS